jgi:hypothetical protein
MPTYYVDYAASYIVEADNAEEAIDKAVDMHENLPTGEWMVEEEPE